jgi:hypothetical protein
LLAVFVIISYGCAGPTPLPGLVDAVTSTPLQTRTPRNNILSYPAALSGASGLSLPSPFKLSVNQYKNIFISQNNNNKKEEQKDEESSREIKPEALQQYQAAQSQFHPKYVTPQHTQDIRPYRQVEHYIIRPTMISQGFDLPATSQDVQESQEIQQDYTTGPAAPQAFQLPAHHIPYSSTPAQQHMHKQPQHVSFIFLSNLIALSWKKYCIIFFVFYVYFIFNTHSIHTIYSISRLYIQ